ncbi:MAG: hypothetical protein JXB10_18145, partial [Pirellulales bacterium]|nr:hypothetical protein [Pirellulales bacterium]
MFYFCVILLSVAFLAVPSANATLIWDSDITTLDDGVQEGPGDWNTTNYNWWDDASSVNTTWDSGAAQFGYDVGDGAGDTVTVDAGGVSATGLTFLRQYTLQGGPITLTGTAPEIAMPDGAVSGTAATINSDISTTGDLVLRGAYATPSASYSKIILGGSNTYNSLTVTDGALCDAASSLALDGSAGVAVDEGSSLRFLVDGTFTQNFSIGGYGFGTGNSLHTSRAALMFTGETGAVDLSGNIELTADASLATGGASNTVSGIISGDYKLTKTSTGTLKLTNQNTFTGALEIYRDSVELDSSAGPALQGDVNFASYSSNSVYLNLLQDGQLSTSSVLHFTGYRGYVNLNGNDQAVGGLDCDVSPSTAKKAFIDASSGTCTLTINTASGTEYTYAGALRNNGGILAVLKKGTGTQNITGGSSSSYVDFSGGLTVENGTLYPKLRSCADRLVDSKGLTFIFRPKSSLHFD